MAEIVFPAPPRADADDSVYQTLREGLHRARYYNREVCAFAGVEDLGAVVRIGAVTANPESTFQDALTALCQLFLWSRAIPEPELRAMLGEGFVDALLAVGLLAPYAEFPGTLRAQACVLPLADASRGPEEESGALWVAFDRLSGTEAEREAQPEDVVFCPMAATGLTFLNLLPRVACERFVEVCAGCGPAALLAGSFAREVVASDLAARSVAFARFVARLNGISHLRAQQGADYDGLQGPFDLIAAHPPYMPALGATEVYYGGGSTGMDITESLIRGVPKMVAPGGLFFAVTMLFEGAENPAESLVREWLGEDERSYDVVLFPEFYHSALEAAQRAAIKVREGYAGMERAYNLLASRGYRNAVVGIVLIRRHREPQAPVTARRRLGERVRWQHILWSLEAERQAAADADGRVALEATYKVTDSVELVVIHRPSPEGFAAAGFKLKTSGPFAIETQVDGWMSYLLARADGSLTGRQLMESCIADQMIHPETPPGEFAKLLWTFVGGAALESSACPLPKID